MKANHEIGQPNPDGYGTIYATAKDGTAYVLDRRSFYDGIRTPRSGVEWAVHVRRPGQRRFEWNETYGKRSEAVFWIRCQIAVAEGRGAA